MIRFLALFLVTRSSAPSVKERIALRYDFGTRVCGAVVPFEWNPGGHISKAKAERYCCWSMSREIAAASWSVALTEAGEWGLFYKGWLGALTVFVREVRPIAAGERCNGIGPMLASNVV